jgi:urea carboxylase
MWNRYRQTADFKEGNPWLLRFFDQIRFYPVSERELNELRKDFITGRFKLKVEEATFSLNQYNGFLRQNADSISAFKGRQQAAFEEERDRWGSDGQSEYLSEEIIDAADAGSELDLPRGAYAISAHVTGTVWKVLVKEGQDVTRGAPLMIIESMKMEITLDAPVSGKVSQIRCRENEYVSSGQMVIVIEMT